MQRPLLTTLIAAAAGCATLVEAGAAGRPPAPEPQIIQGIGAEEAAVFAPQPAPQRQPVRTAAAQANYGGGFIEMLVSRGNGAPAAAPPARLPQAPAGQVL